MNKFQNPHLDPLLAMRKIWVCSLYPCVAIVVFLVTSNQNFIFLNKSVSQHLGFHWRRKVVLRLLIFVTIVVMLGTLIQTVLSMDMFIHITYWSLYIQHVCKYNKNIIQFLKKKEYKEKNQLIVYNFTKLL